MENLEVYLDKKIESKDVSWNKELKPCHVQSKSFSIVSVMSNQNSFSINIWTHHFLSLINVPYKTTKINENHFQDRAHCNSLVRHPHPVIKNTRPIIYYKMNKKSVDGG